MGLFGFLRRRSDKDLEKERREFLQKNGRITDGRVIDSEPTSSGGEVVFYVYSLNGVDFESSELLPSDRLSDPLKYAPGAKVGVRYDPRNQGNSMLD
ncbi:MAG TPA: hypothetical protein PKD24_11675 [Pyrinomonadaceae bacterium]|nr:hypothetical protein [Pyrinomonadaceae bacterium]HMP66173.1 hypothetical protein [Pyrinomonadaceae bacterium]